MLGREHEEGGAEEGVRPRREDRQVRLGLLDAEDDLGPLRAADPVPLHRQHVLGPGLEEGHLLEERVRVVGDAEEPLLEALRLDLRPAALAVAVDHLLVGEDGLVDRAPVDQRLLPVGEAGGEELEEDPLRPAVVGGLVARDLAVPVDRPPHAVHLLADRGDVPLGDDARMAALPDGRVLGGEPEGVVAHRAQDLEAHAAADVREHVSERVVLHVPHVELARRVREHLEDVGVRGVGPPGLGRVGDAERLLAAPRLLPLQLDCLGVVSLHRTLRIRKGLSYERPLGSRRPARPPRAPWLR